MTTTQAAILAGLQTAMLNLAELHLRPKRHHRPKYDGAALRAIRAEKGVGRPLYYRLTKEIEPLVREEAA